MICVCNREVDSILDQVEAVQKQKEEKKQEKRSKVLGKKKHLEADKVEKIPEVEKILAVLQKVDFQKAVDSRRVDFVIRRCFVKPAKMDLDESGLIYGRPFDDEAD